MSRQTLPRSSRLQLVLSEKDEARIKRIQSRSIPESKSAVVRTALDLYYLLVQEKVAGSTLLLVTQTDSGPREREMMIF